MYCRSFNIEYEKMLIDLRYLHDKKYIPLLVKNLGKLHRFRYIPKNKQKDFTSDQNKHVKVNTKPRTFNIPIQSQRYLQQQPMVHKPSNIPNQFDKNQEDYYFIQDQLLPYKSQERENQQPQIISRNENIINYKKTASKERFLSNQTNIGSDLRSDRNPNYFLGHSSRKMQISQKKKRFVPTKIERGQYKLNKLPTIGKNKSQVNLGFKGDYSADKINKYVQMMTSIYKRKKSKDNNLKNSPLNVMLSKNKHFQKSSQSIHKNYEPIITTNLSNTKTQFKDELIATEYVNQVEQKKNMGIMKINDEKQKQNKETQVKLDKNKIQKMNEQTQMKSNKNEKQRKHEQTQVQLEKNIKNVILEQNEEQSAKYLQKSNNYYKQQQQYKVENQKATDQIKHKLQYNVENQKATDQVKHKLQYNVENQKQKLKNLTKQDQNKPQQYNIQNINEFRKEDQTKQIKNKKQKNKFQEKQCIKTSIQQIKQNEVQNNIFSNKNKRTSIQFKLNNQAISNFQKEKNQEIQLNKLINNILNQNNDKELVKRNVGKNLQTTNKIQDSMADQKQILNIELMSITKFIKENQLQQDVEMQINQKRNLIQNKQILIKRSPTYSFVQLVYQKHRNPVRPQGFQFRL